MEANTAEVRQATVCPKYGALALHVPPPAAGAAVPLVLGTAHSRCARSVHCTKPAGHPGFCSGPKAAAAAAAAGRGSKEAAGRSPRCAPLPRAPAPAPAAADDASSDEAASTLVTAGALLSGGSSPAASGLSGGAAHGRGRQSASSSGSGVEVPELQLPPGLHTVAEIPTGLWLEKVGWPEGGAEMRMSMSAPVLHAFGVHCARGQ